MHLGRLLRRTVLAAFAVLLASLASGQDGGGADPRPLVLLGAIDGAIGPATAHHVERLIEDAAERRADALVLRIDTPGGLTDSTRDIVSAILGSPVPVIGWVAPPGAHAASAGTYILYATHLAAMAPGTNLGAATPVQMGGMPGVQPEEPADDDAPEADGEDDEEATSPRPAGDAMTRKITNDAVAFIRSLAEMRDRNADWAEEAVREGSSLSASRAAERDVIEIVAEDIDTLLAQADGRPVGVLGGERVLQLDGAAVETVEIGTVTRLLGVLSNPNIALVLMMIGIYGLIFEFATPGSLGPGIIGAIALALGLYSLNLLPLDYAGLALIVLGVAFMVAEAVTPAFGVLGLGGIAAFVMGSAMLIDTDVPAFQVSWWLIGVMAAVSGAVLVVLLGFAWRAYRRAPEDTSSMIGAEAEVLDWSAGGGHVWAAGERWNAIGPDDLSAGERVRVERMDGLTLRVARGGPPRESVTIEGREGWSR